MYVCGIYPSVFIHVQNNKNYNIHIYAILRQHYI